MNLLVVFARKLVRSRELLWTLTLKEIKVRYKQSLLGVGWAIFVPVAMMLIFTFIFNRVAEIDLPTSEATGRKIEYPVFAYCGLLPWTFFAQSLSGAVSILVTNRNLVTKIYFPREVFPLSRIFAGFADFLIASTVLAALMVGYGVPVGWTVVFVPVFLVAQILFTIGCALILSMANLFYRDVQYVFQVGIQLWMFGTAVIYPIEKEKVGDTVHFILSLNPMTPILEGYRSALLYGRVPDFASAAPALAIVVVTLLLGIWAFDRAQYLFAERI